MKLAIFILSVGLVGATSANAASTYYIGEHLKPTSNFTMNFQDVITKSTPLTKKGNIATLDFRAAYAPNENIGMRAGLPVYFASSDATAGAGRNSIGNVSVGGMWSNELPFDSENWNIGYFVSADVYIPTSRKVEANFVAFANPTTDLYRYLAKTSTINPHFGLYMNHEYVSLKSNFGYGYSYIQKSGGLPSDQSRNNLTWQTAASWHAINNGDQKLDVTAEYNTIILDSATKAGGSKFRNGLTPSISGQYSNFLAAGYVTIPFDSTTRDVHSVAFGANLGYVF